MQAKIVGAFFATSNLFVHFSVTVDKLNLTKKNFKVIKVKSIKGSKI